MPFRQTKIIATIGPASQSAEKISSLIQAGVNLFRFNFSHGDHQEKEHSIKLIRKISAQLGAVVSIIGDLQGPKIRTGSLPDRGITLVPGQKITLTTPGNFVSDKSIPIDYPFLANDVRQGDRILLDDGLMEIHVQAIETSNIHCQVISGGLLLKHKGINLPGVALSLPALTAKDIDDIMFCIDRNFDFIALSFVRQKNDITMLRDIMKQHNANIPIIAKIEKPEALQNFDAILSTADVIMLARGDLGVEINPEKVPLIQKRLIKRCNAVGKPVITATQMLESMIHNPRPTRAETSDVANAILDGTDAVMLSGETAIGSFPVQAVIIIDRIALDVEQGISRTTSALQPAADEPDDEFLAETISRAACQVAEDIKASAILAFTMSGRTATLVAKHRPATPIIAVTASELIQRRINLHRGVHSLAAPARDNTEEQIEEVTQTVLQSGILNTGDRVVITMGCPIKAVGSTNLLKVHKL
jgi:pyruvate kinase